ncbi:hypothetical protein, partial [Escherichia coli]|uniref:hypothetical protein n=1 Tax=Escherichia coli TaxID=562 RepID=UPI0019D138D1
WEGWVISLRQKQKKLIMLPSETMIWQPEFTDKTLSRKTGAVQFCQEYHPGPYIITCLFGCCCSPSPPKELEMVLVECFSLVCDPRLFYVSNCHHLLVLFALSYDFLGSLGISRLYRFLVVGE